MAKPLLIHGTLVHTVEGKLEVLENTYVAVKDGKIVSISQNKPEGDFELIETTETQLIIPGLIDTHIHAPQYVFAGCGLDLPLLDWLNTYTFPAESKFKEVEHARKVYENVVAKTLASGTTTAVFFATIDNNTSLLLSDICKKQGQRAFIGKVSMDRNSPDYYIEETDKAITAVSDFVKAMDDPNSLAQPILTPRFVPSCTEKLMKGIASIHNEHPNLLIQSHVSENTSEIEWVHSLHPECPNYTSVYDMCGLLNAKTILAHGVHLTDDELRLLAERHATIAHCPSSNFQLFSGACDVRRLQAAHVNVSLGTDLAGGESSSMIHAMRNALVCSRSILFTQRKLGHDDYKPLTVPEVLYLATEAGARAVGLEDKIGNFKVGKEFDALVVDMQKGYVDCFGQETKLDLLDKFVHQGDDRNVVKVFVRGNLVKNEQ
ncbi:Guanine deaminase [Histomonas meleagridis]|uniref:Guanine deaminase n=1 Tax=Histomonas meleagridis TaxID=135588 RepID=UPI00355A13F7|nr:Guanine deaminase [Histomonas meleagridis]KAH0797032.1 Guanine deaminase [Histomonas meleagridis]